MASLNKVIIAGNVTRDLEIRYTPNNNPVCDMCVAVNETSGKGESRKKTTAFIDVTVWGTTAENCVEFLRKGSSVLVDGRLTQDSWRDKDTGKKRTKLKVTAFAVQFLDSKNDRPKPTPEPEGTPVPDEFGNDDLPF